MSARRFAVACVRFRTEPTWGLNRHVATILIANSCHFVLVVIYSLNDDRI